MSRSAKYVIVGLLVFDLMAFGFTAFSQAETLGAMSIYMPAIFKNSGASPPTQYDLVCDPVYEINIVDEEVHFKFHATALKDGSPLEDVDLKGTLDTGSQTPSNIERTNFNGVADFHITVLIGTITKTPVATVTFADQATYGSSSCTIDFSQSPPTPPPPTATPPPLAFDVVCDNKTEINIHGEEVHFKFSATALANGLEFENVDLMGTLDTGSQTPFNVEKTKFDGEADFHITVLIGTITQTPFATVAYNDQGTYGDASCNVSFSGNALLEAILTGRSE